MGQKPADDRQAEALPDRIPDIISQIKNAYVEMRPAERRVADIVLANVHAAVAASNIEMARQAGVSEPTVTRFCRAIGCEGVRDFKLKLAQSLVVGALYLDQDEAPARAPVEGRPSFWNSVLNEARNALAQVDHQLDPVALEQAAELVAGAQQVVVFGLGGSTSVLAQEAQYRLFRYGVSVVSHSDPYVMRMTACTLGPKDLVIAISASGKTREVMEAVEIARQYRARSICITTSDSELAAQVDVKLTVAVPEYPDVLKPTASRFAFLAIIDLLATAVGYRLGGSAREAVRRIKYQIQIRRAGNALEPIGD